VHGERTDGEGDRGRCQVDHGGKGGIELRSAVVPARLGGGP
jgi:hypothetical protein